MTESVDVLTKVRPTEQRHLPSRFDLDHAVAFFLHDQLADLVVQMESTGALSVPLTLEDGDLEELDGLEGEELWEWLELTGRVEVLKDLSYRQVTIAVVSDAAHFICESLLSSAKGKTTVAYALLRKPLKENLLLLEWLCGSPDDFLGKFNGQDVRPYVLNRLSLEERKRIIGRAAEAVSLPGVDAEFLWAARFEKDFPNSLESLWTKATHLVTSVKASATEPGNLNFIFSSPSAREDQWAHFYSLVPLMLRYVLAVAEEVAGRFFEWDEDHRRTQLLLREIAWLRWIYAHPAALEDGVGTETLMEDLADISFPCRDCDTKVAVALNNVDRLWLSGELACTDCGAEFSIWSDDRSSEAG